MKFSIKDFFGRSHLLKKSLMENFIFCAVLTLYLKLENLYVSAKNFQSNLYQHIYINIIYTNIY